MTWSTSGTLAVEVEGVSKTFRSREGRRRVACAALVGLDLVIPRGDIVAVVGLNGSGKSTLIRVIATLTTPDCGSVRVFGHDTQRESRVVRRCINRVSVEASFFKEMSALENLSFAARLYGRSGAGVREEALTVLRRLGLGRAALARPMKQLSRGQQQKVAIARSVLSTPNLLLMDEPTTGLDPRSKREVQAFIRKLHGEGGITVLLSTHDLAEVEALCQRVVVIDRGRIVAELEPRGPAPRGRRQRMRIARGRLPPPHRKELRGGGRRRRPRCPGGHGRRCHGGGAMSIADLRFETTAFLGFFERQRNLYRRYWLWEVVWLVYAIVAVLSVGYLASGLGTLGALAGPSRLAAAQLYLLVGALLWQYLSMVFFETAFAIVWERWEGTIEHTFMAPVRRVTHLLGCASFALVYALLRTAIILALLLLAFHLDLSHADPGGAVLVLAAATLPVLGLGILTSILPLLYPEKGEQMAFAVQGVLLLVSGVYYPLSVLPGWLQAVGAVSPLTYILEGIRASLLEHRGAAAQLPLAGLLTAMGMALVAGGIILFARAERRAQRLGLLKRSG